MDTRKLSYMLMKLHCPSRNSKLSHWKSWIWAEDIDELARIESKKNDEARIYNKVMEARAKRSVDNDALVGASPKKAASLQADIQDIGSRITLYNLQIVRIEKDLIRARSKVIKDLLEQNAGSVTKGERDLDQRIEDLKARFNTDMDSKDFDSALLDQREISRAQDELIQNLLATDINEASESPASGDGSRSEGPSQPSSARSGNG
jgi:hypothetical protein